MTRPSFPHRRSAGIRTRAVAGLVAAAAAVAGMAALAPPAQAAVTTTLTAGQCRTAGAALSSGDGFTTFALQTDGNLVARIGTGPNWSSGTAGSNADRLCMQTDGNLVAYRGSTATWQSHTAGTGTANRLTVQNDGNTVVYTSADKPVWQTATHTDTLVPGGTLQAGQRITSLNGTYYATMQTDGNLVVRTDTTPSWSTGTAGRGTSRTTVQTDGNLVVYTGTTGGTATWNSNTSARGTTRVVMQNDGNLVAYNDRTPVWSSRYGLVSTQPAGTPQAFAQQYMTDQYQWGADQFSCLDNIYTRESGWRYDATNPSSGAYGIPQSYPADKMASAGADWRTNPQTQIKWGLGYIKSRYGTPCGAWAWWQDHHSY